MKIGYEQKSFFLISDPHDNFFLTTRVQNMIWNWKTQAQLGRLCGAFLNAQWTCQLLSHVQLFVNSWTIVHQAPLSMEWIHQARILEWVAIPFSRGSSQRRDQTQFSCTVGRFFTVGATREAHAVQITTQLQSRLGPRKILLKDWCKWLQISKRSSI